MQEQESNEEYVDDKSIGNSSELWRRIPQNWVVKDANGNGWRPSSAAFQNHRNGSPMSVFLGDEIKEAGEDVNKILIGHENYYVVSVTAGVARNLEQGIRREEEVGGPSHAEVFGNKTKSVRKGFVKKSTWLVAPKDAPQE